MVEIIKNKWLVPVGERKTRVFTLDKNLSSALKKRAHKKRIDLEAYMRRKERLKDVEKDDPQKRQRAQKQA